MSGNNQILLRAIRPKYAEMIFSGKKTLELFRIQPACFLPVRLFLYVSGVGVSGSCTFHGDESLRLHTPPLFKGGKSGRNYRARLIDDQARRAGLNVKQLRAYINGAKHPAGFQISTPRRFPRPVPLAELRQFLGSGFFAPQSFRYLQPDQAVMIERAANTTAR